MKRTVTKVVVFHPQGTWSAKCAISIHTKAKCTFNGFLCLWRGMVRVVEIFVILLLLLIHFLVIVVF
jgi:hypothetical protein